MNKRPVTIPPPPPPRPSASTAQAAGMARSRGTRRSGAARGGWRSYQTLEERENSPIIHLKKLNNWTKNVLIQLYARPGDCVVDLPCGKIKDCMTRYNGDTDQQQRKKFSFPARLICTDCYKAHLDEYLYEDAPFDMCSCQHALDKPWQMCLVSVLLRPGGIFIGTMPDANVIIKRLRESEGLEFGNSVYWISFGEEYTEKKFPASRPFGIKCKFQLEDAVDCPEWVVPFHLFKLLAEESFHEFVNEYLQKPEFTELMWRLGALGDGRQDQTTLSQDEWDLAFVLRKRGQPPTQRRANNANRGKMFLTEGDIEFLWI